MRILLISPTQSGIGGIAQHIQTLIKFLEKEGHYVETISSDNTFIIPINGLKNPSFLITAAIKAMFKRDFDIVNGHHIPSALAMRLVPGKKILSIHNLFSAVISSTHGKFLNSIAGRFERIAITWPDVITVVSYNACKYYEEIAAKIQTDAMNICQIPNGVDISMFTSVDRRYDKQVISVGRLASAKGTNNLIEIAGQLPPDVNLLILGAGPEEHKIRAVAESHKNIHYLGYKKKEETIALIRGSDILLQPSLFDETSSSILEAMTCGTAVITSDLNGTREMITNNESGILVDSGNPSGFVSAISRLLEDTEERSKMATKAAENAKKYSWDVIGKKYIELYESLL
ncbi:MAG: glycosyltransferase family 1 protein [Nitrosopumilus sp. D6]|nr:MAG: glycosyltransferase family 1 protein [Nitrosopumilus sp. D6]